MGGPVSDDMDPVTGEWPGPSGSFADSRAVSRAHQGLRAAVLARAMRRASAERVEAIQGRRRLGDGIKALGRGAGRCTTLVVVWYTTASGEAGAADRNGRDGVASRNRAIGDAGSQQ